MVVLRKILAGSLASIAIAVVIWGAWAEIASRHLREPLFEPGVVIGVALIVSGIPALVAYLLWPR